MYFQDAFRTAFPNLSLLMGTAVESSEALGLVSRMLGKPAESAAGKALDANVGQLLPHLNTATLRTADANVRVAEMETLVRAMLQGMLADDSTPKATAPAGDESTAGAEAIATLDSQAWARVLTQPQVQAMIIKLEPLNVSPIVEYRVIRILLEDASAPGIQIATGKCKPAHKMLRVMGAACSPAAALLAVQRTLYVESGERMLTWYEPVLQSAVMKLLRGNWDITGGASAADGTSLPRTDTLDLWNDFAGPMLIKRHSIQFLSALPPLVKPGDFFTDERRKRLGTPVILEYFAINGMSGEQRSAR